LLKIVRV